MAEAVLQNVCEIDGQSLEELTGFWFHHDGDVEKLGGFKLRRNTKKPPDFKRSLWLLCW